MSDGKLSGRGGKIKKVVNKLMQLVFERLLSQCSEQFWDLV